MTAPTDPAPRPTCATCRWWEDTYGFLGAARNPDAHGECRIRSAVPYFPIRRPKEWCGEHAPVDGVKATP